MTVRFAAARSLAVSSPVARALSRPSLGPVANDDPVAAEQSALLASALREFAAHGLGAAQRLAEEARAAHAVGDNAAYARHRDLCHTLDRRLARALDAEAGLARE